MINILKLVELIKVNDLGEYILDDSLKKYTSLNIGGKCALMYFPKNISSLVRVYKYLTEKNINYFVIGNGTNLLISEKYFDSVFINLKNINKFHQMNKDTFYISAGANASKVSKEISKLGYTGLEFCSVIPGTIGGLIYMNASAYGKNIESVVEYVVYLTEDAKLKLIQNKNINFNYRYTIFQKQKGIILGCIVKVQMANFKDSPMSKIKSYVENKKNSQPIGQKNAGSTFKNNENKSAWKVIDELGFRGKSYGGAMVSKKHANFIINYNNATFDDVKKLISDIKQKAKEELNTELECEWQILE